MNNNWFSGLIDGINGVANKVFEAVLMVLPTSPFVDIKSNLDPFFLDLLGYVNYYIPMSTILGIMVSWLGCIAIYYAYQLILRTIKAVE